MKIRLARARRWDWGADPNGYIRALVRHLVIATP